MKKKLPKIKSNFAVLDVTVGRKALENIMPPGSRRLDNPIPIVIYGYLSHQHGNDDGVSIEFGVDVTKVSMDNPS